MRIENAQIDLVALPLSECGERSEVFVGQPLPFATAHSSMSQGCISRRGSSMYRSVAISMQERRIELDKEEFQATRTVTYRDRLPCQAAGS